MLVNWKNQSELLVLLLWTASKDAVVGPAALSSSCPFIIMLWCLKARLHCAAGIFLGPLATVSRSRAKQLL